MAAARKKGGMFYILIEIAKLASKKIVPIYIPVGSALAVGF